MNQHLTTPNQKQRLEGLLHEARKRLIETGTRNRLVHTNRKGKRPSSLQIVGADAEALFLSLARGSAKFRFAPDPHATERERRKEDEARNEVDELLYVPGSKLSGDLLQTRLGETALQLRLTRLAREAKTIEEEQGANILYLAIGFLQWYEDEKSQVLREAPLLLLPISLERDARRSTYVLSPREEDISTNLPLAERLMDQDGIVLPEIPEGDEWTASDYFDAVSEAVASRKRWSIDRSGIELGFFSFAKLLMFRDLAADAWRDGAILDHPLLRGLMQEGFGHESPLFPDDTKLDDRLKVADLVQVVDADSSQTLAIETVRAGRNLVIHGPPGTGKSQTIANIIAAAAHDGKTVLFIAEKMVALEVVHRRLRDVGLGPICLELHSHRANKRAVVEELRATLEAGVAQAPSSLTVAELSAVRDRLNDIAGAMHKPVAVSGRTPFQVVGELARAKGAGIVPPATRFPGAANWTQQDFEAICEATRVFGDIAHAGGGVQAHPWRGVGKLDLQPNELDRLNARIVDLGASIQRLRGFLGEGAAILPTAGCDLQSAERLGVFLGHLATLPVGHADAIHIVEQAQGADPAELMQRLTGARALMADIDKRAAAFQRSAFTAHTSYVRQALVHGTASIFKRWGSAYKLASADLASWLSVPLPKKAQERLALIDDLEAVKLGRVELEAASTQLAQALGPLWRATATDFDGLVRMLSWIRAVRAAGFNHDLAPAVQAGAPSEAARRREALATSIAEARAGLTEIVALLAFDLPELFGEADVNRLDLAQAAQIFKQIAQSGDRYEEWRHLRHARQVIEDKGLGDFLNALASGQRSAVAALDDLRYARAEQLWSSAREGSPVLSGLQSVDRTKLVENFQRLDKGRLLSAVAEVRARHAAAIPRGALGDMGVIRGEIGKKRAHMPLRKLIQRTGGTIQKLKPVFLMSPISVAQYLPPGSVEFDLLVIDEASQVRPEDALGVIARVKQVVVVGDAKQLPPTSFFSRVLADEPEGEEEDDEADGPQDALAGAAKIGEMESILTLCEARGVPSKLLRWHYRSKHPSLIEISNREFYKDLFLPPSPATTREEDGFVFMRVDGVYDRGGKRSNEIEAKAVVAALAAHAARNPDRSIGIVTFSTTQRDLVSNLIEAARRSDEVLNVFLDSLTEEVFVKNLENVQGDERDHILVSVGYGPQTPGGRLVSANFGPVSKEGGERRLNVLFTRARYRCEVFCSFDPADIDTDRAKSQGAAVFKRYLAFAMTGIAEEPRPTGGDYDSPFEEDVAREIRAMGYLADPQVGTAGFKIDLGVRDAAKPGRYLLAIECDGATYHGALWARERDRLRQEILESQGWTFHRIWSTDWFYRREAELVRLKQAIETAAANSGRKAPKVMPTAPVTPAVPLMPLNAPVAPPSALIAPPYRIARALVPKGREPHELSAAEMAPVVKQIIDVEGPIHTEEVARRVAEVFGKERTGARIQAVALDGLKHLMRTDTTYRSSDQFWFTARQEADPPVRSRTNTSLSLQKAAMLPPIEIKACILKAVDDNGGLSAMDLSIAVARIFGFQRTGPDIKEAISRAVDGLIESGVLWIEDGQVGRAK